MRVGDVLDEAQPVDANRCTKVVDLPHPAPVYMRQVRCTRPNLHDGAHCVASHSGMVLAVGIDEDEL